MDMNELKGKVLKVNLARPMKTLALNPQSNRASASFFALYREMTYIPSCFFGAVWESEEWLKEHVKPLAQAGGVQSRFGGSNSKSAEPEEPPTQDDDNNDVMEE